MYEIETGVPMPTHYRLGTSRYPFAELEEGQSFFVPLAKGDSLPAMQRRIGVAANNVRRRTGKVFRTARVDDKDEQGVRVWCVSVPTVDAA